MSESDPKLLEGLRALAADGPREAPTAVEERLLGEFRKRWRARKRNRWLLPIGVGAIAAGIVAAFAMMRPAPAKLTPMAAHFKTPAVPAAIPKASTSVQPKTPRVRHAHRRGAELAINFYRVPGADELPPIESATIVRIELPLSSLRLMGMQVNEERADDAVQADVLLGQDGLARGVRFVK